MAKNGQKKKQTKGKLSVRGRGDYTDSDRAHINEQLAAIQRQVKANATPLAGVGGRAGRVLGNMVGRGDLGEMAGSALSKVFGFGDYTLKTNSLMNVGKTDGNQVPVFGKDGKRGVRIVEKEFLGDIFSGALSGGATVFNRSSYSINPADSNTFPWLSRIATQFDQWEPNGIIFEFKSTSSEFNGTSQALGAVILATDYNSVDSPFINKQEMENADYACSTKAAHSVAHGIECDPDERPTRLLYTGSPVAGETANMYNLGNFQIATQGMSVAGINLGELWVTYDITFYKKQLNGSTLVASQSWQRSLNYSTTLPLGSASVTRYGDFQLVPVVGFTGRYQLPAGVPLGYYQCIYYMDAASGVTSASIAANLGCTVVAAQITQPPYAEGSANGTTRFLYVWGLNVTAPNAQFTITGPAAPLTINSMIWQMTLENTAWVQTA